LAESLEGLQERVTAIQSTIRLMQFGVSAKQQIQTLVNAYGTITAEVLEQAIGDNAWELNDVESKLRDSRAWDDYRRDNAKYIEAVNALSPQAKALIKEHGRKKAIELAREAVSTVDRLGTKMSLLDSQIDDIERSLKKALPDAVETPTEDEQDLRTLERVYQHHLEHANKFENGTCETCGQPVKIKDPAIIKKKLKAVREKIEQHEDAKHYQEILLRRRELKTKRKTLTLEYNEMVDERDQALPLAKLYKQIRDLPRKPQEFTGKKLQTEVLEKMKIEILERKELLKFVAPHVETIVEYLALTPEQIQSAKNMDELADKMTRVQGKYTQTLTKLEIDETIRDQLDEMRARLRQMKKELRDEPYVKMLVQGYSDKNIKKLAVDAISERLMTLVNSYAARIYQENLQFEFIWDSDVQLLVHRQAPGKKPNTTDVRKLSGAESLFFTLILVCALLNFVPSNKRCNVMILDEPTAHLSPENIEILQDILKMLNAIVPSIIVITPHSEEIYEGARAYTIVKRNGVSVVKKGMPHEIVD
jgi:DNA repair exonuclease SbcCD ATPase subunit